MSIHTAAHSGMRFLLAVANRDWWSPRRLAASLNFARLCQKSVFIGWHIPFPLDCVPEQSVTVHAGRRSGTMDKRQTDALIDELPEMGRPRMAEI